MVRTYSSFKECTLTWHKILVEVMLGGKSKPCLPLGAVFSRIADVDNGEERRPGSCTAPEQPGKTTCRGQARQFSERGRDHWTASNPRISDLLKLHSQSC